MSVLSGLQPAAVFSYFEALCAIPHGSRDTKAISDYCVSFAKAHGLRYRQDDFNNVIIWKPGTPGYETAAPVILQGHLDMVCAKAPDSDFDFETEGLRLRLADGYLSADGTTLGGDDGIAIAYALALLASETLPHPPLEAVFTVDEEIGMLGAAGLDCSDLKGRTMLNIDSEEEGYLLVSCAGGVTACCHVPIIWEQAEGKRFTLRITGLTGGHSGAEIHKGRANANQLLGRLLWYLTESGVAFQLCSVCGGEKDNAIAVDASAVLCVEADHAALLLPLCQQFADRVSAEYAVSDPGFTLDLSEGIQTAKAMDSRTQTSVITALVNLPNGVQKMSHAIAGLVQTSLNLGILRTEGSEVTMSFSVRSSVGSEKEALTARLRCLMAELGGSVTCNGDYPAWEYRAQSRLRDVMVSTYKALYGKKPKVQALHAGLECGLFSDKLPGLDCVSFGPDMEDIHTARERLSVASVARTWDYICAVLKQLH